MQDFFNIILRYISFKKQKRKFVIILGAGRCGTTYLLQELNKIPYVNIYGESNLLFVRILEAISDINISITHMISFKKKVHFFQSQKYKKSQYNGFEWYQNLSKLKQMRATLQKTLYGYFGNKHKITGFKEIRFHDIEKVRKLRLLEKKYDVFYIHLVRNLDEQAKSAFWKEIQDGSNEIEKINDNISMVLGKNVNYMKVNIKDISDDISIVKKFIGIFD